MEYRDFNEFLHTVRTEQLRKLDYKATNILHVGAAGLWYYKWFIDNYKYEANHTGVDLNARPEGLPENIRWFQRDVCYLDFAEDEEFDMVFAGQFIEHISWEAQCRFFAEVNRVLKKGGIFVVDSPNAIITRKYAWFEPEHIHELEYQQAYTLLKLSGFEIKEEMGILPQKLLKTVEVSENIGGWVKASNFNQVTMNIEEAFSDKINDCFIYWFVAQKQNSNVNFETMMEVDELYYKIKPLMRAYCSNTGKLCEIEEEVYIESKESGAVLFGPYSDFESGEYEVEFTFRRSQNWQYKKGEVICQIDVVAGQKCDELSSLLLLGADFESLGNTVLRKKLHFIINETSNLQFRVISFGDCEFYSGVNRSIIKIK